jgi:N-acetylglutamate synthase-like GNAT family acetyltransferase
MTTALHIRPATPADAAHVAFLIQQHVPSGALLPRSPDFVAERANDFLVAVDGERVVGCVHHSEYSPSLAEVRSLAVDAAYAGRGADARLLDAVEQLARQRQYPTLFAVTNDEALFRERGYEPHPVPELYPERDEVARFAGVFGKELG